MQHYIIKFYIVTDKYFLILTRIALRRSLWKNLRQYRQNRVFSAGLFATFYVHQLGKITVSASVKL